MLLLCALVLAPLLEPIERAFGGLDRVAPWHRGVAVTGGVLQFPRVALVSSAPDRYATPFGHALSDVGLIGLLRARRVHGADHDRRRDRFGIATLCPLARAVSEQRFPGSRFATQPVAKGETRVLRRKDRG